MKSCDVANLRFSNEIVQPEIPELDVTVEDTATQPESVVGEIYVVFRDFRQSGKSDKRRDRPRRYLYQKDLRGILAQFPVQLFRLLRRGERRGYLENFDSSPQAARSLSTPAIALERSSKM